MSRRLTRPRPAFCLIQHQKNDDDGDDGALQCFVLGTEQKRGRGVQLFIQTEQIRPDKGTQWENEREREREGGVVVRKRKFKKENNDDIKKAFVTQRKTKNAKEYANGVCGYV